MRNTMKRIVMLIGLMTALFVRCTTYDSAEVYHKNFRSGSHDLLQIEGFYTDTLRKSANTRAHLATLEVKPTFLYPDGSVWSANHYVQTGLFQPTNYKNPQYYSWGNYKIKGDTILIERFTLNPNSGAYERIILRGIMVLNGIKIIGRRERKMPEVSVNYDMVFMPFAAKPDPAGNWIRTKKKYNK